MSWQLLCQCLSPHVCQRGCFSNCIQNAKLVVFAVYIAPFLSQSILASLVNRTLFPWCLWKFCSRVDFMSAFIPAETTKGGGGGGCTVYMRKLAPAPVSYRGDFLILYRVYMMMGHFMSRLFEGTLHVDKITVQSKIAKIAHALPVPVHRRTDFTPEWVVVSCLHDAVTKFRTGVKFSPWYNSRGELTPE